MDIWNRYLMRASGEKKHQPQSPAESATFAMLGVLRRHGKLDDVLGVTEVEKNTRINEIVGDVGRSLERWRK